MGSAKDDYLKTGTRKRKSKVDQRAQKGGYDLPPPGPVSDLAPSPIAPIIPFMPTVIQSTPPSIPSLPFAPMPSVSGGSTSGGSTSGGSTSGGSTSVDKLVLLERKKKGSVILTRKDPRKKKLSGQIGQTRKLRIHMGHLRNRMTRAKDIHKKSRDEDIENVTKTLMDAGLIKGGGKPSEERTKLLRGIYRDYLQLRTNAL